MNDSFEGWDGAEVKMCEDLVYKVTLANTANQKRLYKLNLKLISKEDTLNLRWPINGLKGTLLPDEPVTFAFAKVEPTARSVSDLRSEIEKFKVELIVKPVVD